MTIGLLACGDLGVISLGHFLKNYDLKFVMTDYGSTKIIEKSNTNNIPVFVGKPKSPKIDNFIKDKYCEILVSVNYLFIIDENIINLSSGLSFNIHGSLLPKYRGRTPHVWAIINGEKETGITAHIIDKGCDTGPILEQVIVPIDLNDSGWDILDKFKKLYIPLIEKVLEKYSSNQLRMTIQDDENATFYSKRTPNDGIINWDWDSTKIVNWVRAQRYPYPGAFTYYFNKKIIIESASMALYKHDKNLKNGTIICINPLMIKCSDSAIRVNEIRQSINTFKLFKTLG